MRPPFGDAVGWEVMVVVESGQGSRPRSPVIAELLDAAAGVRTRTVDEHMFTVDQINGSPATCRLQLFTGAAGVRPVVVATQASEEPGASLTNGAERFAAVVWERLTPGEAEPPIWVQRTAPDASEVGEEGLPEGWWDPELVTFDQVGGPDRYSVTGPGWTRMSAEDLAVLVGQPVDLDRGEGYRPRPPDVPELIYRKVWVVRLPRPTPFREPECMPVGTPWWRRWGRQLVPYRGVRDCCWYHGGDWHQANQAALRLVAAAVRAGAPAEKVAGHVLAAAKAEGITGWQAEALYSLVAPAWALDVGRRGRLPWHWGYTNGQHRAQAMLDAGVRRTIRTEIN